MMRQESGAREQFDLHSCLEVPLEFLEPPSRGVIHDLAALELDHYLRRLARQESLCRRVMGRLASAFLGRRAHHRLGFGRLGDYTRERLGVSARDLQSAARVAGGLEQLPKIASAFDRGELSWSQVRLLVGVATAATEADWLTRARGRTVRALEALIKAGGAASGVVGSTAASPGSARGPQELDDSSDDETVDGEPRVHFRLRCPRRIRSLWRDVVELARRMAGEQCPVWQAAEAIGAEGLSASEASGMEARTAGTTDRMSAAGAPAAAADPDETLAAFDYLDWSAISAAIPDDVAVLGEGCGDLDAFALDVRLRAVMRARQRIDWQMGRLLRSFFDLRLDRMLGFSSASRYVRERLGISIRKARALVAIERKTWHAPEFAAAYQAGAVSWVRGLLLLPVLSEHGEAAWTERANQVTVRRLAEEVEWTLDQEDQSESYAMRSNSLDPPEPGAPLDRAGRPNLHLQLQMCAREDWAPRDAEVHFAGPASVVGLLESAIATFAGPVLPRWAALERLLVHVRDEWERQPRHRDPVFARDGWRCAVPACSARKNLHDHHVRFRSLGGDNSRENRVTLCAWHHLRGVHHGRVRAWGTAPDGLYWELGVWPGRTSLLRFIGDYYIEPARVLAADAA